MMVLHVYIRQSDRIETHWVHLCESFGTDKKQMDHSILHLESAFGIDKAPMFHISLHLKLLVIRERVFISNTLTIRNNYTDKSPLVLNLFFILSPNYHYLEWVFRKLYKHMIVMWLLTLKKEQFVNDRVKQT